MALNLRDGKKEREIELCNGLRFSSSEWVSCKRPTRNDTDDKINLIDTKAMAYDFREENRVPISQNYTLGLLSPSNGTIALSIPIYMYIYEYNSTIPRGMICLCCSFPAFPLRYICLFSSLCSTTMRENNRKYLMLSSTFVPCVSRSIFIVHDGLCVSVFLFAFIVYCCFPTIFA